MIEFNPADVRFSDAGEFQVLAERYHVRNLLVESAEWQENVMVSPESDHAGRPICPLEYAHTIAFGRLHCTTVKV